MSFIEEESITPSHVDSSTTVEDEFGMFAAVVEAVEYDSYMLFDNEFDFPIDESYMVRQGNITCFYYTSVHEKLDEILSEVHTISMEIRLEEYCRRLDTWGHRSVPTGEETEVNRVVATLWDDLHYFLQSETSKSRFSEMVSHLNIRPDYVESVALNISDLVKKAHEAGKKMVHIVAEFKVLVLIEEEDEEEALARALRESMDLAYQRSTDSAVPASRSSVEALERMTFNKGAQSEEIKCTICLNDFSTGMEVIRMPCSHIFDVECIIQWLEMNHVCPLCRFEMPQQLEI